MVVLRSVEEITIPETHLRESVELVAQLLEREQILVDIEVGLVSDPDEDDAQETTRILVLVRTPVVPARFLQLIADADGLLRRQGLLGIDTPLALDFRPEW